MAKQETGAQLLARLNSRPSLEALGRLLPGSPHYGAVVELYGGEGCAKSELLLNLLAAAILPASWKGVKVGGLGVKAVLIDTDYKFSIHRLAILLESRIKAALDAACQNSTDSKSTSDSTNGRKEEGGGDSVVSTTDSPARSRENLPVFPNGQSETDRRSSGCMIEATNANMDSRDSRSSPLHQTESLPMGDLGRDRTTKAEPSSQEKEDIVWQDGGVEKISAAQDASSEVAMATDSGLDRDPPSQEEVEGLIFQTLASVFVFRCNSSHQLITTLCSLDSLLSATPDVAMLVIDSVSTFHAQDRCSCEGGGDAAMAALVGVLSRLISDFNLLLLVSKAALYKRQQQHDTSRGDCLEETVESGAVSSYVEYLGRDWHSFVTSRNILTRTASKTGSVFTVTNNALKVSRRFVVREGGVDMGD